MKDKSANQPFIVSVPEPCSQDWNEMKPVEKGRFCTHCQKTVIDFSGVTDKEVFEYFTAATTVPCGRFRRSQLDTNLRPQKRKQRPWKFFYCHAAALLAFFTLKSAAVFAQGKEPVTVQPAVRKPVSDSAAQSVRISGTVKGEDGIAIENAGISFDNKSVAKSGGDGSFVFETTIESASKPSFLSISYPGLRTVVRSYHPAMRSTSYNVILEKPHFDNGYTTGAPVTYKSFAPQTFEQPVEMHGDFRKRLADMAATFRNNPNLNVLIIAYGTTSKERRAAKGLTRAVKMYFVEKEGIGEDRFFAKIKPMQKGKERTFDIEPNIPE